MKQQRTNPPIFGAGALLTVFVVLCLVIFAVLCLTVFALCVLLVLLTGI